MAAKKSIIFISVVIGEGLEAKRSKITKKVLRNVKSNGVANYLFMDAKYMSIDPVAEFYANEQVVDDKIQRTVHGKKVVLTG